MSLMRKGKDANWELGPFHHFDGCRKDIFMQICWAQRHIYARKLFPNLHLFIMVAHISSLGTASAPESIAPNANFFYRRKKRVEKDEKRKKKVKKE